MKTDNPYQLDTPEEVALKLAEKMRIFRLERKWKQATLAERAGVSLASLRRFERTGQISLKSLLGLSFAMGRLGDFESLFQRPEFGSIRELEAVASQRKPKRGTQ